MRVSARSEVEPRRSDEVEQRRLGEAMRFIQLMARTFSTLDLNEPEAIGDTLSALSGTFLDAPARLTLTLGRETEALALGVREGVDDDAVLLEPAACELWRELIDAREPVCLDREALRERWPQVPAALEEGIVAVAILLHEEPLGLLVLGPKLSGEPIFEAELAFLSSAVGLAAMAYASAEASAERAAQQRVAEQRAQLAAEEAAKKQAAFDELDVKLSIIASQRDEITRLSTPILQLHAEVLALPIIGTVDPSRGELISRRLMDEISRRKSSYVLLDLTGVEQVNPWMANYLVSLARTCELLGSTCVLTGIGPALALSLVGLDTGIAKLATLPTLGAGLAECLRRLKS